MSQISIEQIDKILNLIEADKSVEAVKFLVENTDYSLREAKALVDHLVENPNADPNLMNISHNRNKFNADQEIEFENHFDTTTMSSIITHYSTEQVIIKYDNGMKVEIDEFHPLWQQTMQKFGRGKHYSSKLDFLNAMQSQHDEFSKYDASTRAPQPYDDQSKENTHILHHHDSKGVEDLSHKSGIPTKLMIVLILILLGVAIVSYTLQG